MNPVRLVCNACLQSVELIPDRLGRWPTICPVCQGNLESQLSDVSTPETRMPVDSPTEDRPKANRDGNDWSAVWERGSLGTFARFQRRERLGGGGFGEVFKAYDPRLDRDVALKTLKSPDPDDRVKERFYREARAVARLDHPNIAKVHDSGCEQGTCWIAYQYVPGPTLNRWLTKHGRSELATTVRIILDLARALDHAHSRAVYHRDLKPSNVIIDGAGKAWLIDFGLSRFADVDSELTREGGVVGSTRYMAPEQAQGRSREADARSDIYSLGVIFYEMLCGQNPTAGPSVPRPWEQTPAPAVGDGLVPPRAHQPSIPVALEKICLRALEPRPSDRYQSAGKMIEDLERWLRPRTEPVRPSPWMTNAVMAVGGALLLTVGLVFTLAPYWGGGSVQPVAPVASSLVPEVGTPPPAPSTTTRPILPGSGLVRSSSRKPAAHVAPSDPTPHYYRTPAGERYHVYPDCPHCKNNAREITEREARMLALCTSCEARFKKEIQEKMSALPDHR